MSQREPATKAINLALQGGGAHGAFTWGVLDRLLAEDRLRVEAVSGTSAGAMNAVVLADGLMRGGREGAREALERFWWGISVAGVWSPIKRTPLDVLTGRWNLRYSPFYWFADLFSRVLSPYQFNPLGINPLREFLVRLVDFDRLRSCTVLKLYISATSVHTGRVRVFTCEELTPDVVMASACLPFLFRAVEIDGEPYWDGGYMGNPVLYPFIYECASRDVVLVQINPMQREGEPFTAHEIVDRVDEINFNSSLLAELRAIEFVARLLDEGALDARHYRHMFVHRIDAEEQLKQLGASSKLNAEWAFFTYLRDIGRAAADEWLATCHGDLGRRSTVDLRALLGVPRQHRDPRYTEKGGA